MFLLPAAHINTHTKKTSFVVIIGVSQKTHLIVGGGPTNSIKHYIGLGLEW